MYFISYLTLFFGKIFGRVTLENYLEPFTCFSIFQGLFTIFVLKGSLGHCPRICLESYIQFGVVHHLPLFHGKSSRGIIPDNFLEICSLVYFKCYLPQFCFWKGSHPQKHFRILCICGIFYWLFTTVCFGNRSRKSLCIFMYFINH